MNSMLEALLVLVLLLNLVALGSGRIRFVIRTVALQGMLLGLMPILVHEPVGIRHVLVSLATIGMKGLLIPAMLQKAMRDVQIKREVEPFVGLIPSMLLGALGTGLSVALARFLPMEHAQGATLIVPASLATVLTGFLLLTTRLKAISQVLGYLVLENGIFIFGLLLFEAMPFQVEMGVLLDLLVAIFVMGIILNHISREFSSLDTRRLASLKD